MELSTPLLDQPDSSSQARLARNLLIKLAASVLLINFFVIGLAGLSIYQSRIRYDELAANTTLNLAHVLHENIDGIINKVDVTLLTVQDEGRKQIAAGGIDPKALTDFLAEQQGHQTGILSLRATDAQGVVRYGLGVPSSGGPNNSDREYFIRARDESPPGLITTKPVFARIDKKWAIVLARRLSQPDGSFAGVVYVNLALEHLTKTFSVLKIGPHGAVTLRDKELSLVARYPEIQEQDKIIGSKPSLEFQAAIQSNQREGTLSSRSTLDKIERTLAYRKVSDKPFYIFVGVANDDYLAGWRWENFKMAALVLLFFLVALFSSWQIYRSWKRRLSAAETIREQKEFLNAILDSEPECVKVIAPSGELLQMNRAGLVMLEVNSILEAKKAGLTSFILPEYRDAFMTLGQRVFSGETCSLEFLIKGRRGTLRWLETHAMPLRKANGEVAALVGVTRDITEQKQTEDELKRSNAELEHFAYAVSHDMRQPLRMVTSYLQLVEQALSDKIDPETRVYLDFALDGAKRMDQMILSLLDYSRVGRKTVPKDWLESRSTLDEALSFLNMEAASSQAAIEVSGEWPKIRASRDEMVRLLQNLVGNALKYHEENEVPCVEVASFVEQDKWRVEVRDHGIGIDPSQTDRLFKVFSRLQARTRFEGSGVGLALCRRIVEHHGGTIGVHSDGEGKGSVFWFELPIGPIAEETGILPS